MSKIGYVSNHIARRIRIDGKLLVVEMTVVVRPFVLDFAGAYLDTLPDFPQETWAAWEAEKREQFDVHWPGVQAVLGELETLDIQLWD